jgi:hypothetical protein
MAVGDRDANRSPDADENVAGKLQTDREQHRKASGRGREIVRNYIEVALAI